MKKTYTMYMTGYRASKWLVRQGSKADKAFTRGLEAVKTQEAKVEKAYMRGKEQLSAVRNTKVVKALSAGSKWLVAQEPRLTTVFMYTGVAGLLCVLAMFATFVVTHVVAGRHITLSLSDEDNRRTARHPVVMTVAGVSAAALGATGLALLVLIVVNLLKLVV